MTAFNSTGNSSSILKPEEVAALVVQPLTQESVAMSLATVVRTKAPSYRIPVLTAQPDTGWAVEGEELPIDTADFDEEVVSFYKVSGITVVSTELVADSDPDATAVIGQRLVQSLRRKLDSAWFANTTTNGPNGLGSLSPTVTYGGATIESLDPFVEAVVKAEKVGAKITSFVCHPDEYLKLAQIKKATGSNEALLQPDPASPTGRTIAGVPVATSVDAPLGVIYALPKAHVFTVIHGDPVVSVDTSVFWTSDRVAVKVGARIGFGWPFPAAVGAILVADDDAS